MKRNSIKWNIDDIMDFINEIEEKFDVDTWVLDGIHIWPVLRMQLALELNPLQPKRTKTRRSDHFLPFIKRSFRFPLGMAKYCYASIKDRKNNADCREKAEAVFITYDNARRFRVNNAWFDVYCDPFIELLGKRGLSSLVLEYGPAFNFKIPRFNKSRFIQPKISLLSYLNALTYKNLNFSDATKCGLTSFYSYLNDKGMAGLTYDLSTIKLKVGYIRCVAEYLKSVFRKVGPLIVFGSNYYGLEKAVNLACRELGITSVDIQHSVQGEAHRAYGRWNKVPKTGYELLPDIFWTWTSHEAETIRKWNKENCQYHKAIVGGNLALKMFKEDNSEIVEHYDSIVRNQLPQQEKSNRILLTLATDLGLSELYRDAIVQSPENYFWWIRLHPIMSPDERQQILDIIKSLVFKNLYVDIGTDLPLYAIIRHMDLHITDNSTSILECEQFGVPSIITHYSGTINFRKQIESGIAVFADTSDKLIEAINIFGKKDQRYSPKYIDANQAIELLLSFANRREA